MEDVVQLGDNCCCFKALNGFLVTLHIDHKISKPMKTQFSFFFFVLLLFSVIFFLRKKRSAALLPIVLFEYDKLRRTQSITDLVST